MLCENCVHKNVCRYKSEFENLKNDIAKTIHSFIFQEDLNPIELGIDIQDR